MTLKTVIEGILSGPDALWDLDDDRLDSAAAGNAIHATSGTNTYGATIIPTESGNMGVFNGSGQGVLLPDDPLINTGVGYAGVSRAIALVFECDTIDTTNGGRVLWKQGGATTGFGAYTYLDGATPKVYFTINEGGALKTTLSATIATGTRYTLVFSFDATADEGHLYLNNVLEDSETTSLGIGASLAAHTANPEIGFSAGSPALNHLGASYNGGHDGKIGFVSYWSGQGELSSTDVAALYYAVEGVTATGATVAPAQTGSGQGSPIITGTGSSTAPAQTGTGQGSPVISGTGATTAPAQTGTGTGSVVQPTAAETVQLHRMRVLFNDTHDMTVTFKPDTYAMKVAFNDNHDIKASFG